jgi:hypothetical protein
MLVGCFLLYREREIRAAQKPHPRRGRFWQPAQAGLVAPGPQGAVYVVIENTEDTRGHEWPTNGCGGPEGPAALSPGPSPKEGGEPEAVAAASVPPPPTATVFALRPRSSQERGVGR